MKPYFWTMLALCVGVLCLVFALFSWIGVIVVWQMGKDAGVLAIGAGVLTAIGLLFLYVFWRLQKVDRYRW